MIQNILFNEKWLKAFSPIPLNFNLKEVQNYIKIAEVIWLRPILNDAFYDELLYQVKNNQLTDENSTALVEAIYPYLGFCVALESLPFIWSHISEVGLTKSKSDNSESITLKDLTYIESHLRRQVEARKDYLISWLDTHCKSFPLYRPSNCGDTCCGGKNGLNEPSPLWTIYSTKKKNTDLK